MRKKPGTKQSHGERVVKDIRRATRKQYSAEEKIRIFWYPHILSTRQINLEYRACRMTAKTRIGQQTRAGLHAQCFRMSHIRTH